jgi:hypothetical protein
VDLCELDSSGHDRDTSSAIGNHQWWWWRRYTTIVLVIRIPSTAPFISLTTKSPKCQYQRRFGRQPLTLLVTTSSSLRN